MMSALFNPLVYVLLKNAGVCNVFSDVSVYLGFPNTAIYAIHPNLKRSISSIRKL